MRLKFKTKKQKLNTGGVLYDHYCKTHDIFLCDFEVQQFFVISRNVREFDLIITQRGREDTTAYICKLVTKDVIDSLCIQNKKGRWLKVVTSYKQDTVLKKYFEKDRAGNIFFYARIEY